MDRRYQVFVSSTYADLQEERQEVMQALLELDCIPAGMELFPAANEDQWTLVKQVIDDCDYYIVILAGRYGSVGPEGRSYTEMEYRYALETAKPIMAFVHANPGTLPANRCEDTEEGKSGLESFRNLVQRKMCRFWDSPADLGSQVSRSLVKLIKTNPSPGWVRGDMVPDEPAAEEILRLQKAIDDLHAQLTAARTEAPDGTERLAQGEDETRVTCSFAAQKPKDYTTRRSYTFGVPITWNEVFAVMAPLMIDEAPEAFLKNSLVPLMAEAGMKALADNSDLKGMVLSNWDILDDSFQTIKVQLRALGLIAQSNKNHGVKDTRTYWRLTPYGDTVMTRLRAILRDDRGEDNDALEKTA